MEDYFEIETRRNIIIEKFYSLFSDLARLPALLET